MCPGLTSPVRQSAYKSYQPYLYGPTDTTFGFYPKDAGSIPARGAGYFGSQ